MNTMTNQKNGVAGYQTSTVEQDPMRRDPGRGADDAYLLSIARHNNCCMGVASVRIDDEGMRNLAADLAPMVFSGNRGTGTPPSLQHACEQLEHPESVVHDLAERMEPPPEAPTPEAYKAWVKSLLETCPTDDLVLKTHQDQASLLRDAKTSLEYLASEDPSLTQARAREILGILSRVVHKKPDPSKMNHLIQRFTDCRQISHEMTAEVWERTQAEFQRRLNAMGTALALDCAQAIWQSLLQANTAAIKRWLTPLLDDASQTLEACRIASSSHVYHLDVGPDVAGGRTIHLPGPSRDAVNRQVLQTTGSQDLPALACHLRKKLDGLPRTPAQARQSAQKLVALVREHAGLPSAWSHIHDIESLCLELFRKSHPPASLRYLDSELNTDPCHHVVILGPPPLGAQEESMLSGLKAGLGKLACCSVDFVPGGGMDLIRVARVFAGYPSVADSSDEPLRGAYLELASLNPHRPHPLGSRLTGGNFLMDLAGKNGNGCNKENLK